MSLATGSGSGRLFLDLRGRSFELETAAAFFLKTLNDRFFFSFRSRWMNA